MQAANTKFMIESAQKIDSPIAAAIRKATEVGVVVPSVLLRELAELGLSILIEPSPSRKSWRVRVRRGVNVLAMGQAGDESEALLHACLGYCREVSRAK